MPIITLEVVGGARDCLPAGLAQLLADAVGRALKSPAGKTWVRLRSLPLEQYAGNESSPEASALPIFVTILKRQPPQGADLENEIRMLTGAIAVALARPESCVHIEYAPSALGRLSFGGRLVQ